ncbi:reductase PMI12_05689 [Streptomyces laurentii]|uniref:Reductase PMI12_05689 n=1 Tax=Streptomyces laurentii TaxID=39478 RepID=A0A160NWP7_STRLU|nr:reductase PMI12_05689 [Streptomyces laurentii]
MPEPHPARGRPGTDPSPLGAGGWYLVRRRVRVLAKDAADQDGRPGRTPGADGFADAGRERGQVVTTVRSAYGKPFSHQWP